MDILSFSKEKGPEVIYGEECSYCGACVMDCPASAISIRYPPAMWLFAKGIEKIRKN
jgi:ferredoxin